ncbi:MAG: hypothetical protein LQ342_002567 [Letrouitia transgressa]|nr:MAG: hypothetical protein LQ342_002567 [Letrouitia transgressa]
MRGEQKPIPFGSVLVIGGCGFLGYHIVNQLVKEAIQVSVLDLRTNINRVPGVSYYDGDITSFYGVYNVIKKAKPQIIIHTASPLAGTNNSSLYHRVNVEGTRNLIGIARQNECVKVLVYTSSASVVHDGVSDLFNADESLPVLYTPQQTEIYSHTKALAEDLVLAANRKHRMLTAAIRPAGIFGEADSQMIPGMMRALEEGKQKFQLGDKKNLFDFTYVRNVVHGHLLAAQKLLEASVPGAAIDQGKRVDGEAFFITNEQPCHFWDFARAIWAEAGDETKPEDIWVVPKGLGLAIATIIEWIVWIFSFGRKEPNLTRKKIQFSTMTRTYNTQKAKDRLGYEPVVNLEDGIRRAVRWYIDKKKAEKSTEKKQL